MNPSNTTPWKDRLRQERIARNWRQQDLADQLLTSVLTIQRWERGSHRPSAYFRLKSAELEPPALYECLRQLLRVPERSA